MLPAEQADVDEIMGEFGLLEADHVKALERLDEQVANTDKTGWWNKTGWVDHLKCSNLQHLSRAARLPAKEEVTLRKVMELVEACIEQSVKGLMILPTELRRWLKSSQVAEVDRRPMGRLQNESSQDIYANYFVRLICYCLRVLQSEDAAPVDHDEVDAFTDIEASDDAGDEGEDNESNERNHPQTPGGPPGKDDMFDARRLFPWRDGQRGLARRLLESVELGESAEQQMDALLKLCEPFIFQKVYADVFESPLVHFVAVLGIDPENNRLRTGNEFSYMLAGVVYCMRVVALEILLPGERRSAQGEAEFESFLQRRRTYLADGTMSPMSTMISLLAYGKHLALNHGNAGSIFWEMGDRVMRLHSSRIVMDKFREMMKKAIGDAEHTLWTDLMWQAERFEVDLDGLTDDFTFRKRGAYFVNNAQNGLEGAWKWMVQRMKQTKEGRKLRTGKKWNRRRVKEYLRVVDRFQRLLLFCAHGTGGQPKRGSEVLSMRFRNGCLQDRNSFVLDGMMMLVNRYYKSQSQWDVPKAVPSFLPWRAGQLMALYLIYVQPFAARLSVAVGHGSGWSDYIWADANGPWETPKLTAILQRRTGQDLGVPLGTLEYRHVAVGIGRKFVGDEFARGYKEEIGEVEEPEVELEDPLEQSAGRGAAVGVNRYAVSKDIVRHLTQRNIDTFRPLSESWHRFLGLASRKKDEASRKRVHEVDGSMMNTQKKPRTAAATTMKEAAVVTGLLTPGPSSSAAVPSSSPLLRAGTAAGVAGKPLPPSSPPVASSTPPGRSIVRREERERAVRKALRMRQGCEIKYKSAEQEEALERIMDGSNPALMVVLPTSGGKTLLVTAPACLDDAGVTIVVVPYRQLINETVMDAKAAGIECIEWTHRTEDPATMVVVSADKLDDAFFGYASLLVSKGLVRRVFVDEAHLAVTAHSWRYRLVRLAMVQTIEAPLIMLTATLPVHMESDVEVTMVTAARLTWIRACTARRSTKYVVRANIKDGGLKREAVKVCRKQSQSLKPGWKMVVYCRTKSECEGIASELGCGFFYSGAVNSDEVLEGWKKDGGCIVATSALGTGVNYPGIKSVVHAGMPYGLIDFAQESGRAGRGGEEVDSLVLVESGWEARERAKRQAKRIGWTRDETEMLNFVSSEGCRRLVLARYFDEAEPQDCISGEMARCDRCGCGVTDWERSQRAVAEEEGVVLDTLDQIAGGCAVCWVRVALSGVGGWLHDGGTCRKRTLQGDDGRVVDISEQVCDEFRAQVRYPDGRTCFRCGVGQKWCNTREERGSCQWPRIAAPVLRAAMASTIGRNIIRQAGYDGEMDDWAAYALWLAQPYRLRVWKELASNSMVVIKEFVLYCRQEMRDEGGEHDDAESVGEVKEPQEDEMHIRSSDDDRIGGAGDDDLPTAENTVVVEGTAVMSGPAGRVDERRMATPPNIDELRALVDGWKRLCVICKIKGRISRGHTHWKKCNGAEAERRQVEEAVGVLQAVRFAAFSHCQWCYRSPAMCELWQRVLDKNNRVAFKKRPGIDCEYGTWLLEATAALLAFRKDGVLEWKARDPSLAQLKAEMGKKYRRMEVEYSGMFGYFYKWA
jgi:hypothetical protein